MKDLEQKYLAARQAPPKHELRVQVASTIHAKAKGMLFSNGDLGGAEALLLKRCSSVHTVGMRYALDIAFLDKRNRVVRALRGVRPNRLRISAPSAHSVLERKASSTYWPSAGAQLSLMQAHVKGER